jgi:hypothetical protein
MHPGITVTSADEGKTVVDAEGNTVGRVVDVERGIAYVDPEPDVTEPLMSKLGWVTRGADTFPLQKRTIEAIEHDVIRIDVDR